MDTVRILHYEKANTCYQELEMDCVFEGDLPKKAPSLCCSPSLQPKPYVTASDRFSLYRIYHAPQHDPNQQFDVASVADALTFIHKERKCNPTAGFGHGAACEQNQLKWFSPFLNASTFHLMNWYYETSSLSFTSLDNLVNNVLLAPDF